MSRMSRGVALLLAIVLLLGMFPMSVPVVQGAETDGIVIHSQPEYQHGTVGQTVQFTVEASGVASYEWWYRRSEKETWYTTSLTGYNTKTLSVGVTTGRNGYQYRCKLTGNDGSEVYTEPAALLLEIDILAHPQDQVGVIEGDVQFSVNATGVSSYQWQYRRTAEDNWTATSMTGSKTDTLTVGVLPAREGYQYRCVLTDSTGVSAYTRAATLYLHDIIQEGTCGEGVTWTLDRYGLLAVSGSGKMRDYTPDAPAPWSALSEYITEVQIESAVTQVGAYSFYNCTKLAQLSVADGVSYIGEHAFSGCTALSAVVLPDTVKQIDGAAFSNCTALSEVSLGNGLELLCYHAFAGCTSLKSVSLPEGLTDIGNDAFNGCTALSSVVFPSTLNFIGVNCFYGCTSLSSVAIGGTITNITDNSFAMCTSLTSVALSGPVSWIHKGAFAGCSALTSLTLPGTVETIDSDAFNGCDALTDVYYGGNQDQRAQITVETGNEPLEQAQWHCEMKVLTGVQIHTLPDKTVYEPEELLDVSGLSLILTYNDGSTAVVTEGFSVSGYDPTVSGESVIKVTYEGITVTYSVTVTDSPIVILSQPKSTKAAIGEQACFAVKASGVVSYQWEYRRDESATWLGTSVSGAKTATMYVDMLESRNCYQYRCKLSGVNGSVIYTDVVFLTLEMELLTQPVDQTAMVGQTATFTIEATGVTAYQWFYRANAEDSWHITSLEGCTTGTLSVPVTALRNGYQYRCKLTDSTESSMFTKAATLSVASYVAEGTCGDNLTWTLDADGVLNICGSGEMYDFPEQNAPWLAYCSSVKSVVIDEGITSIGQNAFYLCTELTAVTIPDSVLSICDGAFLGCSELTSVTLGDGVVNIGKDVFGHCPKLSGIYVSEDNTGYCTDEYGALYSKDMLCLIRCPGAFSGTYTIPDTVLAIAIGAFSECENLENVVIPQVVFCIEADTFRNCHKLNNIELHENIQYIDEGAFSGCIGLTDAYYSGSCTQWNEVQISSDNDELVNATIHFAKRSIVNVDVVTVPRVEYFLYEEFDPNGIELLVSYDDGSVEIVSEGFTLGSLDNSVPGTQLLDIFYEGFTVSIEVTFREPVITGVEIWTQPNKTEYFAGDPIDLTGLELIAYYDNGDSMVVGEDAGFTVEGFDSGVIGTQTLTVYYEGFTASFTVTIRMVELESIWIESLPQRTQFFVGEELDATGLAVGVQYNNGNSYVIYDGFTVSGYEPYTLGEQTVTVTYENVSTYYTVTYKEPEVTAVAIVRLPDKVRYITGEELDVSGLVLEVAYENGVTETVDSGFVVTGFDNGTVGVQTITVSYLAYDDSFEVTVCPGGSCGEGLTWMLEDSVLRIYGVGAMEDYSSETSVPWYQYAEGITSVELEMGVTKVGAYAFKDLSNVTSVALADSVEDICYAAFSGCSSVTEITLPDGLKRIDSCAFEKCGMLSAVYIPASVENIVHADAFVYCDSLTGIFVDEANMYYSNDDQGVLFDKDKTVLIKVPAVLEDGYTIPATVTTIAQWSFHNSSLYSIEIPEGVTSIDLSAFLSCKNLMSVSIPASVTYIGNWAFNFCDVLTDVYYGSSATQWSVIQIGGGNECLTDARIHYATRELVGIEIQAVPKTEYFLGEVLDTTGMRLVLNYDDGSYDVTDNGYTVTGFDPYMEGEQWLTVSFGGCTASFAVTVCPPENEDPVIVTQPMDALVPNGENGVFTVVATGVAAYQWQYRSPNSNTWKNTSFEGCTTDTLIVPMITNRNNYLYRCKLTGENGTVIFTDVATLVMDAHISVVSPGDQSALEGSEVLFALETEGIISYRWYYRKSEGDSWHTTTMSGYVTDTLKVKVTTHRDGYQYRCKMRGEDGYYIFSEPATLHVTPCVIEQPVDQTVSIGQNAEFTVKTENVIAYQWLYRKSDTGTWSPTSTTGNKTDSISVSAVLTRNGYQYMCKVTNLDGYAFYTDVVTLSLLPAVTESPVDQMGPIGDKVAFTITGDCIFGYQWQYSSDGGEKWSATNMDGNKTNTLTVDVSAGRNGYKYRCKLIGRDGSYIYSDSATLYVATSIILQPSDQVAQTGEYARFSVGAKGVGLSYQWQYSSNDGQSWNSTNMTGANTAALSVEVTEARNGYRYRCKITDKNGNVTFSDEAVLTVE